MVSLCVAIDASASSWSYDMTVNGASVASDSRSFGGGGSASISRSSNNYSMIVKAAAYGVTAGASADVTASVPAQATVRTVSDGDFTLTPAPGPNGFGSVLGGSVVLYFRLAADIVQNATVTGKADLNMLTLGPSVSGSASRTLANQPGLDSTEFDITLSFPTGFTAQDFVGLQSKLTLDVTASVPGGGTLATSKASAQQGLQAIGFRVFNAAGAQVTGFSLSGLSAIPELAPVAPGVARAIEYYNASYGFYFVTAKADEISDLDTGKTPGWQRTGEWFDVYLSAGSGRVAVCRYYGLFTPKSTHFYAPRGFGCPLPPNEPHWTYEADVFFAVLPSSSGGCPPENVPVYRLYNNGQGGAPNHRFTTSAATRAEMLGEGWIAEGAGIGVGWCSPAP